MYSMKEIQNTLTLLTLITDNSKINFFIGWRFELDLET